MILHILHYFTPFLLLKLLHDNKKSMPPSPKKPSKRGGKVCFFPRDARCKWTMKGCSARWSARTSEVFFVEALEGSTRAPMAMVKFAVPKQKHDSGLGTSISGGLIKGFLGDDGGSSIPWYMMGWWLSSWWLNHPFEKIMLVKVDHFPRYPGWK